jgi:predicted ferric reductase
MGNDPAKVVKVIKENRDITSLYIEGYDEAFTRRRAGSFLTLKIMQNDGWSEAHPFTISCAPEDPQLRVTIKRLGEFTTRVHSLEPGAPVMVAGPYGLFCKDIDANEYIVMIAGGVGITPFLSVLRHFRNIRAKNRILLIWSNKGLEEAFALDELKAMTKDIPLKIVHNLSREPEGADMARYADEAFPDVVYESGRCTRHLMKKHIDLSAKPAVYLCGPPPMQDFVIGELEAIGIDPKSIKKESFTWKGAK